MKYANQTAYVINRDMNFRDVKKSAFYHNDALTEAFNTLSHSAFGLWLYISRNKNGFKLDLSYAALSKQFNISERSYRDAKKELIDKKYAVKIGPRIYNFYEYPYDGTEQGAFLESETETDDWDISDF